MTWRKREIMDMARQVGYPIQHEEWRKATEEFAALVREEQQTEVQRLIALVRAQQITIDKLEAALAQPEQEPVAWLSRRYVDNFPVSGYETAQPTDYGAFPVYTTPPQRKPLTDKQIDAIRNQCPPSAGIDFDVRCKDFARAIEAAHGIKENT